MVPTSNEKKIIKRLRFIRLMNAYLPLSIMTFIINKSANRVKLPAGVIEEEILADNVRCLWLKPQHHSKDQVLLYLHGGGFILGITSLHLRMIAYLVQKMSLPSLVVDYRLGPKYPFPGALDDCVKTYRWLLKEGYKAENIVIAGDSAGGNLALTSLMKLRDDEDKLPAAVACLSPVGALTGNRDGNKVKYDPVLHPRAGKRFNQGYLGNNDPHNPLISPIFGNLKEFPPLLIHAGENEILRDQAVQIESKAKESGVDVHLEIYPRMFHVWQIYPSLPQTMDSLDKVSKFLKSHLN